MRRTTQIIILIFIWSILFCSCKEKNCSRLPKEFSSYEKAKVAIKNASFAFKDSVDIKGSDFLRSASFLSCDGLTGYFFYVRYTGSEYFVSDVPIKLWREFAQSDYKDSIFKEKIENKYTSISIIVEIDTMN